MLTEETARTISQGIISPGADEYQDDQISAVLDIPETEHIGEADAHVVKCQKGRHRILVLVL